MITGQEAYDFFLKNGKQWDLIIGLREGLPSISILEVCTAGGAHQIVKLGNVLNGYDGYPDHYRKEIFPVENLTIFRPQIFHDARLANSVIGAHSFTCDAQSIFLIDDDIIEKRKDMLREELTQLEEYQKTCNQRIQECMATHTQAIQDRQDLLRERTKELLKS